MSHRCDYIACFFQSAQKWNKESALMGICKKSGHYASFALQLLFLGLLIVLSFSFQAQAKCLYVTEASDSYPLYNDFFNAIQLGNFQAVQEKLQNGRVEYNVVFLSNEEWEWERQAKSPVSHAARYGHSSIIKLLVEHGASADGCLGKENLSPLDNAILYFQQEAFEQLVKLNANVKSVQKAHLPLDLSFTSDSDTNTSLNELIQQTHSEVRASQALKNLQTLIQRGIDINDVFESHSVLTKAMTQSPRATLLLISYGVRLNTQLPEGRHILHWMAKELEDNESGREYWELISSYIEAGSGNKLLSVRQTPELKITLTKIRDAIVNPPDRSSESTWLGWIKSWIPGMVAPGSMEQPGQMLQNLLGQMAELSLYHQDCVITIEGEPPSETCYEEDAIDIDQKDFVGNSPLFYVTQKGKQTAILKLIELGASVNQSGEKGDTPLHLAARNLDLQAVNTLIKAGADPRLENTQKYSCFGLATAQPDSQLREQIMVIGALCQFESDNPIEFQFASKNTNCPDFHLNIYDPLVQLDKDLESFKENGDLKRFKGLPENDRAFFLKVMNLDQSKRIVKQIIQNKEDLKQEELLSVFNRLEKSGIVDIIDHTVTHSNIDVLEQLLGATTIEQLTPDNYQNDSHLNKPETNPVLRLLLSTTDPGITNRLLEWGIPPDFNRFDGEFTRAEKKNITALVRALQKGTLDTASILLKYDSTIKQPGLIAAAIESGQPEVLFYILERGYRGPLSYPESCDAGAEVLCKDNHYFDPASIDPDMALILQLFPGPQKIKQSDLDFKLKAAVEKLDAEEVAVNLALGANPHVLFDCHTSFILDKKYGCGAAFLEGLYIRGGSIWAGINQNTLWQQWLQGDNHDPHQGLSGLRDPQIVAPDPLPDEIPITPNRLWLKGLLGYALIEEQNKPVAQVSRTLLLFGASVMRRYDADEVFDFSRCNHKKDRNKTKNCPWDRYLEDRKLARALDYFEQQRKRPVEAKVISKQLMDKSSEASQVMTMLQETARLAGASLPERHLSSPVYSCLGLTPDHLDESFQPHCQKIRSQLTKPLELVQKNAVYDSYNQ